VGDVEQAASGSHGGVLGDNRRVLHRHIPAGEVDQPGSLCGMPRMQSGSQE
jgi:hypothetical protein